jgi:hypothetical protein
MPTAVSASAQEEPATSIVETPFEAKLKCVVKIKMTGLEPVTNRLIYRSATIPSF